MQWKLDFKFSITILIAALAIFATLMGLLTNSYRDNTFVIAAFQGNDMVTLLLLIPLMVFSSLYIEKSPRAELIWMGTLLCMVYNYIFYLYGAAFNKLFLIYVLLIVLSGYTLIFSLANTDIYRISSLFKKSTPTKLISGYLFFFAVFLGGVEIAMCLSFAFTGLVPETIIKTGHPTAVVFATDLLIVVSGLIVSGVLLWTKKPWGYVSASIVLIKASTYGLSLISTTLFVYFKIGDYDTLLPLWIFLTLGSIASALSLLLNIKKVNSLSDSPENK